MTVVAHIVSASGRGRGGTRSSLQVSDAIPLRSSSTLTASGTSQQFDVTAPNFATGEYIWLIENGGTGAIWVRFYHSSESPAPLASAGRDWLVGAGQSVVWVAKPGQRCAIINA